MNLYLLSPSAHRPTMMELPESGHLAIGSKKILIHGGATQGKLGIFQTSLGLILTNSTNLADRRCLLLVLKSPLTDIATDIHTQLTEVVSGRSGYPDTTESGLFIVNEGAHFSVFGQFYIWTGSEWAVHTLSEWTQNKDGWIKFLFDKKLGQFL